MDASNSETIFSKMPRQSCLKKIEHTIWLFVSPRVCLVAPENFEMPSIKFEVKNYRNVKPMPFGSIYFQNSSTPKQNSRICSYFLIL